MNYVGKIMDQTGYCWNNFSNFYSMRDSSIGTSIVSIFFLNPNLEWNVIKYSLNHITRPLPSNLRQINVTDLNFY